jgi:hypothetical protein
MQELWIEASFGFFYFFCSSWYLPVKQNRRKINARSKKGRAAKREGLGWSWGGHARQAVEGAAGGGRRGRWRRAGGGRRGRRGRGQERDGVVDSLEGGGVEVLVASGDRVCVSALLDGQT